MKDNDGKTTKTQGTEGNHLNKHRDFFFWRSHRRILSYKLFIQKYEKTCRLLKKVGVKPIVETSYIVKHNFYIEGVL